MDFIRPLLCSWSSSFVKRCCCTHISHFLENAEICNPDRRLSLYIVAPKWPPLRFLHSQVITLQLSMRCVTVVILRNPPWLQECMHPACTDRSIPSSVDSQIARAPEIHPTSDTEELHPSFTELETTSSFIFVRKLFVLNAYASN